MAGDESHTLGGGEVETGPSDTSAWGVGRRLGRFRLESLLGRGGMGQVFEAWDPRLERRVAIKLMNGGEQRLLARFVREAKVQASLRHPGICPVFEVGDSGGVPFIVMQRLEGLPLDEATEGQPLDAKLELMRRVAEAVHGAHREGLIHRDLKPGNVIVETPGDGPPRPYVLDFGLARPVGADLGDAMTAEGAIVGTPSYMAPEQVRGELDALDRRTDVYGLGATLYRLVAGRPPFQGGGAAFVFDILGKEPPGLEGVPAEVELMVFKCLEKDPVRRYASAKDFAEDLRRYLNGEAIHARPASGVYRLTKWARRHRTMVGALAIVVLVLLAAIAWGLLSTHRAQERERLVVSFVEQVEEMQAQVRYSHMAPLHDTRPERTLLRARMAHIRNQMAHHGALATGAGHFALGSGHLALEEHEAAHLELEAAWAAGYRTPDVAASLAQTLSAIYRERLSDLDLVRDWDSRQRHQEALDQQYGEPARAFLGRRQLGATDSDPLLDALFHFHHGHFEQAIAVLGSLDVRRPWSYELPRLEGEIRRVWAIELNAGSEREAAQHQLDLALEALSRAAVVAASDPSIHRAAAQVAFWRSSYEVSEQGKPTELLERGLAAAGRALHADPEDARAWLWRARLHRQVAKAGQARAEDPTESLELATVAARRAADGLRPVAPAWRELARAQWGLARWRKSRGQDPQGLLDRAVAALAEVPSADRDFYDEHLTAMILQTRAGFHARHAGDAAQGEAANDYAAAVAAYRAATALHTAPFSAWINLGSCALSLAGLRPEEASRWLGEAVEVFERAQELRPKSGTAALFLGRAHFRLAQGGDPAAETLDAAEAAQALTAYSHALELAPTMFAAHIGLADVHHHQALYATDGRDPAERFALARAAYGRALELAPSNEVARLNLAWTDYFEAKLRIRGGGAPGSLLRSARDACRGVFEDVADPWALLCVASTLRLDAEWQLRSHGPEQAAAAVAEARRLLQQLLEIQPEHAEAMRSLGRLETLEARRLRTAGRDPAAALEAARRWLSDAIERVPNTASFQLAMARLELEAADDGACIRGTEAADRALGLRPGWVAAEVVRRQLEDAHCT